MAGEILGGLANTDHLGSSSGICGDEVVKGDV